MNFSLLSLSKLLKRIVFGDSNDDDGVSAAGANCELVLVPGDCILKDEYNRWARIRILAKDFDKSSFSDALISNKHALFNIIMVGT